MNLHWGYGNVEEERAEKYSPMFSALALQSAQGCSDVDMISPHRTNWLTVVPEIHEEFLEFWHKIKPKKGLPTRGSFTEDDLERWSGYLHFVELIGDSDAKYIVYGSSLGELHGRDWTGKRFSETAYEVPKTLLGYYHDVRDARRPLAHVVNASVESKYRRWSRLFIPFGDDAEIVRYIMVHSVLIEQAWDQRQAAFERSTANTDDTSPLILHRRVSAALKHLHQIAYFICRRSGLPPLHGLSKKVC